MWHRPDVPLVFRSSLISFYGSSGLMLAAPDKMINNVTV
ncbi:hypothetical protein EC178200_1392 [Escherichia coli 178200]|nr:hypothetical protein EC3006_1775 [Escherichia coli 3006]EMW80626.1 hypothetical protein EC180600_2156 [Escherichia coli 180600]EMX00487.1 hypothetical protein ECP03047771_2067 [Escherichia coli P0304777.1]EMX62443.1 hypothetical protein ECJURUA1811_2209 [Escherichia coli Jurua 18/11]EMZ78543.1 hypothetical protein EC1999001_2243 [Escherichia coli 199900.1]ENE46538.1 hypothetical protein ECP030477710_2146 [Escherichia coli P0304777.10]ENE56920.1 hypothetical protein ECP030477711_2102 [Esche